jgi:hypothetical protein
MRYIDIYLIMSKIDHRIPSVKCEDFETCGWFPVVYIKFIYMEKIDIECRAIYFANTFLIFDYVVFGPSSKDASYVFVDIGVMFDVFSSS